MPGTVSAGLEDICPWLSGSGLVFPLALQFSEVSVLISRRLVLELWVLFRTVWFPLAPNLEPSAIILGWDGCVGWGHVGRTLTNRVYWCFCHKQALLHSNKGD